MSYVFSGMYFEVLVLVRVHDQDLHVTADVAAVRLHHVRVVHLHVVDVVRLRHDAAMFRDEVHLVKKVLRVHVRLAPNRRMTMSQEVEVEVHVKLTVSRVMLYSVCILFFYFVVLFFCLVFFSRLLCLVFVFF